MAYDKNRPLERLFNSITLNYDRMNKILTLGLDRRWRRMAAKAVVEALNGSGDSSNAGSAVLDLCTGTGDLAYLLADSLGDSVPVTGLDYSPEMLERAEEKRREDPENPRNPKFLLGDAAALPWSEAFFDAVAISFAFRNLTYRNPLSEKSLSEIRRVLKPGGVFVIVESSQPDSKLLKLLRNTYVELMVGKLVARLSGHRPAYRYLAESMKKYYNPKEMQGLLQAAGFTSVHYKPLLFGAAGLYVAC